MSIQIKYRACHIEFVMAPNVYYVYDPETVGLGWAVQKICYDGNSFAPMYNFKDIDGITKVRARSRSFPDWEAKSQYMEIKKNLYDWCHTFGWFLEDFILVRTEELYADSCIKRGLPVPACCKVFHFDEYPAGSKESKNSMREEGFCGPPVSEGMFKIENDFAYTRSVDEEELKNLEWPTKEMIIDTYPEYLQFT